MTEFINKFDILKRYVENILKEQIVLFYVFDDQNGTNLLYALRNNVIFCAGSNYHGQLGLGKNGPVERPTKLDNLDNVIVSEFCHGFNFVLALDINKQLYGWGFNKYCQLNYNSEQCFYEKPRKIDIGDIVIKQICCGSQHTLILSETNAVHGWGDNSCGQVGSGEDLWGKKLLTKITFDTDDEITWIYCIDETSFAITSAGNVHIWGYRRYGGIVFEPYLFEDISQIKTLCSINSNLYLLSTDNNVYYLDNQMYYIESCVKEDINKQAISKIKSITNVDDLRQFNSYYNKNLNEFVTVKINNKIFKINHVNNIIEPTEFDNFKDLYANDCQITFGTIKTNFRNQHVIATSEQVIIKDRSFNNRFKMNEDDHKSKSVIKGLSFSLRDNLLRKVRIMINSWEISDSLIYKVNVMGKHLVVTAVNPDANQMLLLAAKQHPESGIEWEEFKLTDAKVRVSNVKSSLGIFWDIENCPVPHNKSPSDVVNNICNHIHARHPECGYAKQFFVTADTQRMNSHLYESLNRNGVNVVHVNGSAKNAADEKLQELMDIFVDKFRGGAVLTVITSDINFVRTIRNARRKDVLVVLIHGPNTPQDLKSTANETYRYNDVIRDAHPITQKEIQIIPVYLKVLNLPKDAKPVDVYKRLSQLSANCDGKVKSIDGMEALIRFGSEDDAMRAAQRMKGVDCFGHNIDVQLMDSKPIAKQDNKNDCKSVIKGLFTKEYDNLVGVVQKMVDEWNDPLIESNFISNVTRGAKRDGKRYLYVTANSSHNNSLLIKAAKKHLPDSVKWMPFNNPNVSKVTDHVARMSDQLNLVGQMHKVAYLNQPIIQMHTQNEPHEQIPLMTAQGCVLSHIAQMPQTTNKKTSSDKSKR